MRVHCVNVRVTHTHALWVAHSIAETSPRGQSAGAWQRRAAHGRAGGQAEAGEGGVGHLRLGRLACALQLSGHVSKAQAEATTGRLVWH